MFLTLALLGFISWIWSFFVEEENPLDKLPGPPRYPIIGCALVFFRMTSVDIFNKLQEFNIMYGDRYVTKLLNRRILHLSNVNDIEVILSHSRNIKKSKPYTFMEPWLGTGLLLSSGAKWHRRRKILTPTFYFNILKSFTVVMQENSDILVEKLKKLDGTEVKLLPIISDFTLFTICETAMGTQLGVDHTESTLEYKGTIAEIGSILLSRVTKVWLYNEYLFRKLPIGRRFTKFLQQSRSFTDNIIMERKKNWKPEQSTYTEDASVGEKKRMAMLDLLLEAENKGEIDIDGIREEVNTFMFEMRRYIGGLRYYTCVPVFSGLDLTIKPEHHHIASALFGSRLKRDGGAFAPSLFIEASNKYLLGFSSKFSVPRSLDSGIYALTMDFFDIFQGHDTTAMAIVFALMLIADHNEVQEKIYEECQEVLGDSNHTVTMLDLSQMKYLEAVIKETLRLYPSVPWIAREITEDVILGDLPLKKGSEVAVLIYQLHHRADLFPDPEAFKPERFLGGELMHPYAFIPFSAGPRNCIGQRFAMLEMKYVLSDICRKFKLSPHMKGVRPEITADMLIRPKNDVYVKFNKR